MRFQGTIEHSRSHKPSFLVRQLFFWRFLHFSSFAVNQHSILFVTKWPKIESIACSKGQTIKEKKKKREFTNSILIEKKLHDLPQKDTGCLEKLLLLFLFLPIQTLASRTSEKLTIAFEKMRAATASICRRCRLCTVVVFNWFLSGKVTTSTIVIQPDGKMVIVPLCTVAAVLCCCAACLLPPPHIGLEIGNVFR